MNAYELADELRKMFQGEEYDRLIHEIPDMLRQQADRIAELEKESEPIAYIYQNPDTLQPALKFANPTKYWATVISTPDIPLFTTPQTKPAPEGLIDPKSYYIGYEDGKKAPQTKPLSDEEIHELANQHLRTKDHDGAKVVTGLEDFARAIEERHGIK